MCNSSKNFEALPSQQASFSNREPHLTIQALHEEILNYNLTNEENVGWQLTKIMDS
jgi:hypothetical protein